MAARYWVGGTNTWDATVGLKWALTSGGIGGQAVPTSSDTVFFDANSGANTITLGINADCFSLTTTGYTGTLAFGTFKISIAGTGTPFTQATTMTVTGTPVIDITNSTASNVIVSVTSVLAANAISFNIIAGSYNFANTNIAAIKNLNFTGFSGTWTNTSSTIYGDLTLSSTMTLTAGTIARNFGTTTTQTITSNSKTMDFPVTFSGTGTYQLADAMTVGSTRTITLASGTLDMNNKNLTCGLFSSSGTATRSITFGTAGIYVTGSNGTIFNIDAATNFTYTGSGNFYFNYSGSTGTRAIYFGATGASATNVPNIYVNAGSDTVNLESGRNYKTVDFTGFTGTLTNVAITLYGSLVLSTGMTVGSGTGIVTFVGSLSNQITTNGQTLDFPITFSGTGGTWQLQDAMTVGSTRTVTLNNGTLNLNNKNLTCGIFGSNNSNTRTLAFGTGQIYLTGNSGTIWGVGTGTNMTISGTPIINATYSGSTGTRQVTQSSIASGSGTLPSVNISAGSDVLSFNGGFGSVDFTGFSGTLTYTSSFNIYGGTLKYSTGMTLSSNNVATQFFGTGTTLITTNGKTLDFPVTFDGVGGTFQLQDAMTVGSTRTITLTNGTLDMNNKNLTCGFFSSTNSNIRSIAFGTAQIYVTGNNGTVWTSGTATNFSYTGTGIINATYSGSVGTRLISHGSTGGTETNSLNFNITAGSDIVSILGSSRTYKSINLTGFSGTWSSDNWIYTIYGSLTIPATVTATSTTSTYTGPITFGATSATNTITTSGLTIPVGITFDGVGGTFQLQDAMTVGSTQTVTLWNGILDLNNKNLTCGFFNSNLSNTRTLSFGTGQIYINGNNGTVYTTTVGTNLTFTGTPIINFTYSGSTGTRSIFSSSTSGSINNSASFNISSGSDTVNFGTGARGTINLNFTGFSGICSELPKIIYGNFTLVSGMTLSGTTGNTINFISTSGTKTVTSASLTIDNPITFNGIGGTWQLQDALTLGSTRALTLSAGTVQFKNGTTNIAGSFVLTGTLGNNVVLNSTVSGSCYFLSQSSGTVNASYATIKDSVATGGAVFNAYLTNGNVNAGGNAGWNFGNNNFSFFLNC